MQLIQLNLNGKADEFAWADKIRAHLELQAGWADHRGPHDDRLGIWSLLA